MSFAAPHIGFVIASYGISALVIVVLIISHLVRAKRCDSRLAELEDKDILRKPRQASGE